MKNQKNRIKKEEAIEGETPEAKRRMNLITGLIVAFFVTVSFYLRGIIPLERALLKEGLTFAMDDAVFHMRLVENTIANFPHRLTYDAFTNYPYGNQLHWGALFEQMIAAIAIIAGRIFDGGAPSQATINTVGALFPAILGALCVIPAYVIAKELADRKAGIIAAALTAILPGAFLVRSVLGFTDNHIAEVLFLSISVMFFVIALKRSNTITFQNVFDRDWTKIKTPIIYSLLAGFSLGIYLLNWTAGVFFVVVFAAFFIVQMAINHIRKKQSENLVIISVPIFLTSMIMVAPYVDIRNGFDSAYYSLLHVSVPLMALLAVYATYWISIKMTRLHFEPIFYPVALIFIGWFGLVILKIVLPDMYSTTVGNIDLMFHARTGGQSTVAEAVPMSVKSAIASFGLNYYLSFIGLLILLYNGLIKKASEHTLVVVWSIFILAITLAQTRFSYYYAINVAVTTAILASASLNIIGWKNYNLNTLNSTVRGIKTIPVTALVIAATIMFFMPANASVYNISTTSTTYGSLSPGYFEWYFAMEWMKNNTPDTGVDYYGTYEQPNKGERYPYPKTAYGVMSWWDYGHVISYWGHRIPNANPFQASVTTVASFLTAQSEEEGNKIMDDLGSKYVVTDAFMAYGIQPIMAMWLNDKAIVDPVIGGRQNFSGYYLSYIKTSSGAVRVPAQKTLNSMTGRLHMMDTNGLTRYRLVHETPPNPNALAAKTETNMDIEQNYKMAYNNLFGGTIQPTTSGYVKIFEYVEGANVIGSAGANTPVIISVDIRTNAGRNFTYTQKTSSDENGGFKFIVPYSTTGWKVKGEALNWTMLDTKPAGKYKISAGNVSQELDVTEEDVLNGGSVKISLI